MDRTDLELRRLRLPHVNYMEIKSKAGGFSCRNCSFSSEKSFCTHADIRAPISPDHGCCNEFHAKDESEVTFQ